jgi:hypothetical protein
MSSLADLPDLVGFFSYARRDDAHNDGALTLLRQRIRNELEVRLGRRLRVWQDTEAIPVGALWENRIPQAIAESAFFIPIITPSALNSPHCLMEYKAFLAREAELGRDDLVFPILYVDVPGIAKADQPAHELLKIVHARQYADWRKIRPMPVASVEVRQEIARFAGDVVAALRKVSAEVRGGKPVVPLTAHSTTREDIEAPAPADEERQRTEEKRPHEGEAQRPAETQKNGRRRRDILVFLAIALAVFVASVFLVRWGTAQDLRVRAAKAPFRVGDQLEMRIEVLRPARLFCFILDRDGEATLLYPTNETGERANLFSSADGKLKFPDDFNPRMRLGPMPEPAVEFFHCIATVEPLQGTLETKWFENTAARRRNQDKRNLATDRDVAGDILSRLRKSEGYAEDSAKIEIVSK